MLQQPAAERATQTSCLEDVNSSDLVGAIRLGCRTMSDVFDADDGETPFFAVTVLPEPAMSFHPSHSESHVPGRHLNALLAAEAVVGAIVPEDVVHKHAAAAFRSFGGALPLPLNRTTVDGPPDRFLPHNLREGYHALYALTRFRGSTAARNLLEESIELVDRAWDPEAGWNRYLIETRNGLRLIEWDGAFITGIARAIGPLVKYARWCGSPAALQLATRIKDHAIATVFTADGSFDVDRFGTHTHSTTSVMSSLAQFADATGDSETLGRVQEFYDHGLSAIRDPIGWSIESCRPDADPDRGEVNNTGDIVETALILGRMVDPRYFGHAELILRSHLLPSQLRDISFIPDSPASPEHDGVRAVATRLRGAFGFPAPYGHRPLDARSVDFNLDIVGGVVASLCEVVRESVSFDTRTGPECRINLLFDCQTDAVRVNSRRPEGGVVVEVRRPGRLLVRVPEWVEPSGVQIFGTEDVPAFDGNYLTFAPLPAETQLEIRYPLVAREISLNHVTRSIHVRLLGDEVVAMEAPGADLKFFPDLEGSP